MSVPLPPSVSPRYLCSIDQRLLHIASQQFWLPWQFWSYPEPREANLASAFHGEFLHSSRFLLLELSISINLSAEIRSVIDGHMGKCGLLCLIQILEQSAPAAITPLSIVLEHQALPVYLHENAPSVYADRDSSSKYQLSSGKMQIRKAVLQIIGINSAHIKSVIADDFRRDEFVDLIQKLLAGLSTSVRKQSPVVISATDTAKMIFH